MRKRTDKVVKRVYLIAAATCAAVIFFLSGCAAPLAVTYKPEGKAKAGVPVTVVIPDFIDARNVAVIAANPRAIGSVKATVTDMTGGKIILSEDVAAVVTRAFREEFAAAGYNIKAAGVDAEGDFTLVGKVNAFRLDIGGRDEVDIAVEVAVTERETGRVIWSGTKTEAGGRYAGVMGNSRSTISNYISTSLSKAVRGVIDEAAPLIENTRAAYRPAPVAVDTASTQAQAPPQGTGRLIITAVPGRVKVYINEIYYGLTPLNLDIGPGIYDLTVKSKGYRDGRERVSVRRNQMTEVEMVLDKE